MSTGCSSGGEVKQPKTKSENFLGTEMIETCSKPAKKKRKLSETKRLRTFNRKLSKKLRASLWTGRCIKCHRNGKGSNYCRKKVYHDAPDWRIERDCRLLASDFLERATETLCDRGTVPPVTVGYASAHIASMDLVHMQTSANQQWHLLGQLDCFPNTQQPFQVPYSQAPYTLHTNVHSSSQAPYIRTD